MANLGVWTKDQEAELIKLSQIEGITASEISKLMTTRWVGKSSVISKLANLHIRLPRKDPKVIAHKREMKKRIEGQGFLRQIPKAVYAHTEPTSPNGITINQLTSTSCRWPLGANPVKYCGKFRHKGQAYCPTHKAIAEGTGTPSERSASRLRPSLYSYSRPQQRWQ